MSIVGGLVSGCRGWMAHTTSRECDGRMLLVRWRGEDSMLGRAFGVVGWCRSRARRAACAFGVAAGLQAKGWIDDRGEVTETGDDVFVRALEGGSDA